MNDLSHCTSVVCAAPADQVFAFMADGITLGGWALGCFDTEPTDDGVFEGRAVTTGERTYVRPVGYPAPGVVAYQVGSDPSAMTARIWALVVPADTVGGAAATTVLTLVAWRTPTMSDESWQQLRAFHEAEILIIKGQIENGLARHRD